MSYGMRVENDASVLVIDDNSIGYGYVGRASLHTAAAKAPDLMTAWRYRIVMANSSAVPLIAVKLSTTTLVQIAGIGRYSGDSTMKTWDVDVYSTELFGAANGSQVTPIEPEVMVFAPMSAGGSSWGIQLLKPDGVSVAWDFSMRPLWIRQVLDFSAHAGYYSIGTGWVNQAFYDGDSVGRDTGISAPAIIGSTNGEHEYIQDTTGEYLQHGTYGWALIGSTLARRRMWTDSARPYVDPTPSDSINYQIKACRALIINSTGLT